MMIVTLGIENKRPKELTKRLSTLFRPCRISARLRKQNRISVLQLKYELYRGKPDMKRLTPYLRNRDVEIVCSRENGYELAPYRRFECRDFARMMMLSLARDVLTRSGSAQELRAALCDPTGSCPHIAEALTDICHELTVVTNRPEFYGGVSDRLYEERGASLIVSDSIDALHDCDILLCCDAPDIHYPLRRDALVLSAEKPLVALANTVIYDYRVAVPYKYQRLRPGYIDEFSFLSALYTLGGVKELASLVPSCGGDGENVYTAERLFARLSSLRHSA